MGMHKGMIGKIGPGSAEQTLGDYIARKQRDDAFNQVKKKLTFDEWLNTYQKRFGNYPYGYDPARPKNFLCMGIDPRQLEIVWKAAQENV